MPTLADLKSGLKTYGVPVGAQVVGGLLNRSAAGSATKALTSGVSDAMTTISGGVDSAENALTAGKTAAAGTLKDLYGEQKSILQPYADEGKGALDQLKKFTTPGGDLSAFLNDPAVQFRIKQGERGINAEANAGGTRWSGATLKHIAQFNQDIASEELGKSFDRLMQVEGIGERGAQGQVNAASAYGTNLANLETGYGENIADLETGKAKSLADLQTDLASAQAAGDVAKANAISNTISGVLQSVDQIKQTKTLRDLLGLGGKAAGVAVGGAPAAQSLATLSSAGLGMPAMSGAGIGAAGDVLGAGALAPVAPAIDIASAAPAVAGSTAIPAGATGGGGFLGTAGAFLSNPATIAIGAALGIGALWSKSQAHHEARTWTDNFQNDFDKRMAQISSLPNVSPEDKQALKQAQVADYLHAAQSFKGKGSDERKVIDQAVNTFRQYYPEFAAMLPQFGL